MEWNFHAVTVTPWYLNTSLYSLKTLKASRNKKGKWIWTVKDTLTVTDNHKSVMKDAFYIAKNQHVPYIENVNDGQRLTKTHIQTLKDSHVNID